MGGCIGRLFIWIWRPSYTRYTNLHYALTGEPHGFSSFSYTPKSHCYQHGESHFSESGSAVGLCESNHGPEFGEWSGRDS